MNPSSPLFLASLLVCGSASAGRLYDTRDPRGVEIAADRVPAVGGDSLPAPAKLVNEVTRESGAVLRQRTMRRGACAEKAGKARDARPVGAEVPSERCD